MSIGVHPWWKKDFDALQHAGGIGCAAGNDPAGLPNTVNSMIPSGVARGQLIIVSRREGTGVSLSGKLRLSIPCRFA